MAKVELRLRIGQSEAAIQYMKSQLRDRQLVFTYKKKQVSGSGQGSNTRVRSLIESHSSKIAKAARRYRASRRAIINFDPDHISLKHLRELDNDDIRFPKTGKTEMDLEKELREGRIRAEAGANESDRDIPWIWLTGSETSSPETLRVEWSKNRARFHRWQEEVELLVEEMRRVIAYFRWKAGDWQGKIDLRARSQDLEPAVSEGLAAYAERQSAMYVGMAISCARRWLPLLRRHSFPCEWAEELVVGEVIEQRTGRGHNPKKPSKPDGAGAEDDGDDSEEDWEDMDVDGEGDAEGDAECSDGEEECETEEPLV